MKPYFRDSHTTLYNTDCIDGLRQLPPESVQMVVTSPPYWGLRKYSGDQERVWGDSECEHEWLDTSYVRNNDQTAGAKQRTNVGSVGRDEPIGNQACSKCNAWRGAYGLEPTVEMYVDHTLQVLREIRRVLRKDGVVFWNIGDSYSGYKGNHYGDTKGNLTARTPTSDGERFVVGTPQASGIKAKDLCLIPFRVALAAQADGWWIRSVVIWSKPNPMPESVTDRPTDAYEHILMLTKNSRYYWDADAVREPAQDWGTRDRSNFRGGTDDPLLKHYGLTNCNQAETGRNIRNVWEFPTQPYPKAHFAVFPEELPMRCIKAASKEGDTILDPFAGAGTSLWVAKKLNRKSIGFELSAEYCALIVDRIKQGVLC